MGILLCNIILILVSVFHYVILSASVLDHENQHHQIKDESRSSFSDPFKIVNNSLPFNKYAFLTTHTALASSGFHYTVKGRFQNDNKSKSSIAQQLNSGVRALKLNIFDNKFDKSGDVRLCQHCNVQNDIFRTTSSALDLFQEVEEFLTSNPSEVVTLFLEDEVETPNGLSKIFNVTGLAKYMLPLSKMPRDGGDWPRVKDMVAANQRLVVFSSNETKEESEGIGYQANFAVEYRYGGWEGPSTWVKRNFVDGGWEGPSTWVKRNDSSPSTKRSGSIILLNYLPSPDSKRYEGEICKDRIIDAIRLFHKIDSDHGWANFFNVHYEEGIDVGPAFDAIDFLSGKLLCGCDDVNSCRGGSQCPLEVEFDVKTREEFGGAKTKVEFGANTKGEFGGDKTKGEFGVKTNVIVLLFVCAVLGYSLHVVGYLKKKKV